MPFRKRYRSRRRRKFSRKFKRKRKTLGKKLAKLSKFVYKTIERKVVQKNLNLQCNDAGWAIQNLTGIPQAEGTGVGQRIGDDITVGKIQVRLCFQSLHPNQVVRILFIQYEAHDIHFAPADVTTDVLEYPQQGTLGSAPQEASVLRSFYRIKPEVKFKVLKDLFIQASPSATPHYRQSMTDGDGVTRTIGQEYPNKYVSVTLRPKKNVVSFPHDMDQVQQPIRNPIVMLIRSGDGFYNSWWPTDINTLHYTMITRMSYRDA